MVGDEPEGEVCDDNDMSRAASSCRRLCSLGMQASAPSTAEVGVPPVDATMFATHRWVAFHARTRRELCENKRTNHPGT